MESTEKKTRLSFGDSLGQFSYGNDRKRKIENQELRVEKVKHEEEQNEVSSTPLARSPKRSKNKGYAPPEKYAHLKPLTPLLKPGLRCVFIGFNPGTTTALKGHYYAHHSNAFWKMIYQSGCVDRKVTYEDDQNLPDEYRIGFTDLVERPTSGISELSVKEMNESVPSLEHRIATNGPQMICIIGKGIWETIYKTKHKRPLPKHFKLGYQENTEFGGCSNVFVLPSTSGLVAGIPQKEKIRLWNEVGSFLNTNFPLNQHHPETALTK